MEIFLTYYQIDLDELQLVIKDLSELPEILYKNVPKLEVGNDAQIIYFLLTGETKKTGYILSKALLGKNKLKNDYWGEPFLGCACYLTFAEIEETLKVIKEISPDELKARITLENDDYKNLMPNYKYKNIDIAQKRIVESYCQIMKFFQEAKDNSKIIILGME